MSTKMDWEGGVCRNPHILILETKRRCLTQTMCQWQHGPRFNHPIDGSLVRPSPGYKPSKARHQLKSSSMCLSLRTWVQGLTLGCHPSIYLSIYLCIYLSNSCTGNNMHAKQLESVSCALRFLILKGDKPLHREQHAW